MVFWPLLFLLLLIPVFHDDLNQAFTVQHHHGVVVDAQTNRCDVLLLESHFVFFDLIEPKPDRNAFVVRHRLVLSHLTSILREKDDVDLLIDSIHLFHMLFGNLSALSLLDNFRDHPEIDILLQKLRQAPPNSFEHLADEKLFIIPYLILCINLREFPPEMLF